MRHLAASFVLLIPSILFSGCVAVDTVKGNLGIPVGAELQTYTAPVQELNKPLLASVGSVLLRINKTSDLPNIFGKADIYGGKMDRGFTEVRLIGGDGKTRFSLSITDVEKASSETTMERYQPYMTAQQGSSSVNVTTNINTAQAQTSAPSSVVTVDLNDTNFIAVGSYLVRFTKFDGVNLTYLVERQ